MLGSKAHVRTFRDGPGIFQRSSPIETMAAEDWRMRSNVVDPGLDERAGRDARRKSTGRVLREHAEKIGPSENSGKRNRTGRSRAPSPRGAIGRGDGSGRTGVRLYGWPL